MKKPGAPPALVAALRAEFTAAKLRGWGPRTMGRLRAFGVVVFLAVLTVAAQAAALDRKGLQAIVEKTRAETGSPGLGALVWRRGKTMQAVSGVRIAGRPEKIQHDDAWHIGSNGKAMTATLVARDVEAKRVSFDTPLAVIFPELRQKMA